VLNIRSEHGICINRLGPGVRNIFGIGFSRARPSSRQGEERPEFHRLPAKRGARWKRTLLLVPLFVGLFFVAVAERGHPASSKASKPGKSGLLAMLADPLSLFAERSPGERGAGPLLSTKPGGPQERVLSEVRERDPGAGDPAAAAPPGPNDPVFGVAPDTFAPGGGAPGGGDPGDPGGGDPGFFPGGPGAVGPQFLQRPTPFVAPGNPGIPGDPGLPGIPAVPEPATWAMLILGFFAVGAAVRRARKHAVAPDSVAASIECRTSCDP
jgi:hypothetical protein